MTFKYTIIDRDFKLEETPVKESWIMKVLRWFFYPKSQEIDLGKYNNLRF